MEEAARLVREEGSKQTPRLGAPCPEKQWQQQFTVEFDDRNLGLALKDEPLSLEYNGLSFSCKIEKIRPSSEQFSQAENFNLKMEAALSEDLIAPGMYITHINGDGTCGQTFKTISARLQAAKRPVFLTFADLTSNFLKFEAHDIRTAAPEVLAFKRAESERQVARETMDIQGGDSSAAHDSDLQSPSGTNVTDANKGEKTRAPLRTEEVPTSRVSESPMNEEEPVKSNGTWKQWLWKRQSSVAAIGVDDKKAEKKNLSKAQSEIFLRSISSPDNKFVGQLEESSSTSEREEDRGFSVVRSCEESSDEMLKPMCEKVPTSVIDKQKAGQVAEASVSETTEGNTEALHDHSQALASDENVVVVTVDASKECIGKSPSSTFEEMSEAMNVSKGIEEANEKPLKQVDHSPGFKEEKQNLAEESIAEDNSLTLADLDHTASLGSPKAEQSEKIMEGVQNGSENKSGVIPSNMHEKFGPSEDSPPSLISSISKMDKSNTLRICNTDQAEDSSAGQQGENCLVANESIHSPETTVDNAVRHEVVEPRSTAGRDDASPAPQLSNTWKANAEICRASADHQVIFLQRRIAQLEEYNRLAHNAMAEMINDQRKVGQKFEELKSELEALKGKLHEAEQARQLLVTHSDLPDHADWITITEALDEAKDDEDLWSLRPYLDENSHSPTGNVPKPRRSKLAQELQEKDKHIEKLASEIKGLQLEIESLQAQEDKVWDLECKARKLRESIADWKKKYEGAHDQTTQAKDAMNMLEQQNAKLRSDVKSLEDQKQLLAQQKVISERVTRDLEGLLQKERTKHHSVSAKARTVEDKLRAELMETSHKLKEVQGESKLQGEWLLTMGREKEVLKGEVAKLKKLVEAHEKAAEQESTTKEKTIRDLEHKLHKLKEESSEKEKSHSEKAHQVKKEKHNIEKEVERLKKEEEKLKKSISAIEQKEKDAVAKIKLLNSELECIREDRGLLHNDLKEQTQKCETLQKDNEELEDELRQLRSKCEDKIAKLAAVTEEVDDLKAVVKKYEEQAKHHTETLKKSEESRLKLLADVAGLRSEVSELVSTSVKLRQDHALQYLKWKESNQKLSPEPSKQGSATGPTHLQQRIQELETQNQEMKEMLSSMGQSMQEQLMVEKQALADEKSKIEELRKSAEAGLGSSDAGVANLRSQLRKEREANSKLQELLHAKAVEAQSTNNAQIEKELERLKAASVKDHLHIKQLLAEKQVAEATLRSMEESLAQKKSKGKDWNSIDSAMGFSALTEELKAAKDELNMVQRENAEYQSYIQSLNESLAQAKKELEKKRTQSQRALTSNTAELRKFKAKLSHGVEIVKHGRKGQPKRRVLFLNEEGTLLTWSPDFNSPPQFSNNGSNSYEKVFRVEDIVDVRTGHSTEVFERTSRRSSQHRCFSVICVKPLRSLDIEAVSMNQLHELVKGFRLIVSARLSKQVLEE